jgi:serpin B
VALVLVVALVAACGDDDDADQARPDGFEVVLSSVERSEADVTQAAGGSEAALQLGLDLLAVVEQTDGNVVMSPYSIQTALAMARAGAAGTTRTEMDAVLHANVAGDLDAALNAADRSLASVAGSYPVGEDAVELSLATANALWPQAGLGFEQPYLDVLASQYGAGLNVLDYRADPDAARGVINRWVSDRTEERIPELIPEGVVTVDTRLVLTNAVYLNAPWQLPFAEGATTEEPFSLVDGTSITAPLMSVTGSFAYAAGDGYSAIELPYAGDRLTMLVIVPDAGRFDQVVSGLGAETLVELTAGLAPSEVALRFPSFELRTQLSLKETLADLGMPTAFSGEADFSAMTTETSLAITDVVHEGFIAVDEEGTEAAAATAVVIGETALPEYIELRVDRPFLFLLRDRVTGAPLFLGRVMNPTTGSGT